MFKWTQQRSAIATATVIMLVANRPSLGQAVGGAIQDQPGTNTNFDIDVWKNIKELGIIAPEAGKGGSSNALKRITRSGSDTVILTFEKVISGQPVVVTLTDPAVHPKQIACIVGGEPAVVTMNAEVFLKSVPFPATAPGVDGLQTDPLSPKWWGVAYVAVLGRYPNGGATNIIREFKQTLTKAGTNPPVTESLVPTLGKKPGGERTPRSDFRDTYGAQVRLWAVKQQNHEALVMWDTPGMSQAGPGPFGAQLSRATGDTVSTHMRFSSFYYVDCNEDGKPDTLSHQIDWGLDVSQTIGATAAESRGTVTITSSSAVSPPDDTIVDEAQSNDAGPKGWEGQMEPE